MLSIQGAQTAISCDWIYEKWACGISKTDYFRAVVLLEFVRMLQNIWNECLVPLLGARDVPGHEKSIQTSPTQIDV